MEDDCTKRDVLPFMFTFAKARKQCKHSYENKVIISSLQPTSAREQLSTNVASVGVNRKTPLPLKNGDFIF